MGAVRIFRIKVHVSMVRPPLRSPAPKFEIICSIKTIHYLLMSMKFYGKPVLYTWGRSSKPDGGLMLAAMAGNGANKRGHAKFLYGTLFSIFVIPSIIDIDAKELERSMRPRKGFMG